MDQLSTSVARSAVVIGLSILAPTTASLADSCSSDHDCFVPGPPGCSDEACCNVVCALDPFCCEVAWDGICVELAFATCVVSDCDRDGLSDALELAKGLAVDLDGNGIPDDCELSGRNVQVTQLGWKTSYNGEIVPFTPIGQLHLTIHEPADGVIVWANATVDGAWVIQNAPLIKFDEQGDLETFILTFPFAVPQGIPVGLANLQVTLSGHEIVLPPSGFVHTLPVGQHVYYAGSIKGPPSLDNPVLPGSVTPSPPLVGTDCQSISRGLPGVAEPTNACAPGAAARSFAWLARTYNVELPEELTPRLEPGTEEYWCEVAKLAFRKLARDMRTDRARGTSGFGVYGLKKFLDENFPCMFTVESRLIFFDPKVNPCDMFDALKAGKDVMGVMGWYTIDPFCLTCIKRDRGHQVTVSGAVKKGDQVTVYYRDDCNGSDSQGDDEKDTASKRMSMTPDGTGKYIINDIGSDGDDPPIWEGFTAVCPSRLLSACGLSHWTDVLRSEINKGGPDHVFSPAECLKLACMVLEMEKALQFRLANETAVPPGAQAAADAALAKAAAIKVIAQQVFADGDISPQVQLDLDNLISGTDASPGLKDYIDDLKSLFDCNENEKSDEIEIEMGPHADADGNGVLDECRDSKE